MFDLNEMYTPERRAEHARHLEEAAASVRCGYCLDEFTDQSDVVPLDPNGEQHDGVMAHLDCSALWQEDQVMESESERRWAWLA